MREVVDMTFGDVLKLLRESRTMSPAEQQIAEASVRATMAAVVRMIMAEEEYAKTR
jgi:hypothetical protein